MDAVPKNKLKMNRELEQSLEIIKKGGLLLYPTDTVWGIGCDATNAEAISKIFKLKQREESKALICLVSDFKMLNYYVEEIPEVAYDILKYATKPTTIIYDNPIRIAENLVAQDNTLAIRVTKDPFCKQLIQKLKRPLVSTSANVSGEPTPRNFQEISETIKNSVDYLVNLPPKQKNTSPSTIIKLSLDGGVKIIRQ